MIVTLDYNNDSLTIMNKENDPAVIVYKKVEDLKMIQSLLDEIFNMLEPYLDNSKESLLLQKIDEDIQTIIGEW